ncbi:MAG: putative transporter [Myxococcaceae bacterium]|nr:putative transporter [Myxococcaceae bacterium]
MMSLKHTVRLVAALNLAYFFVEFGVATRIGSVSLFADSVDFLEDASVNLLIAVALSWSPKRRAEMGMLLAVLLLAPGIATLWTAWHEFQVRIAPEPRLFSITGMGALAVNLTCAFLLARFRTHSGSLTKAAFLSARNDALANVAIVVAAALTAVTSSIWPDLLVGLGIAVMNADAAREVWQASRDERRAALA